MFTWNLDTALKKDLTVIIRSVGERSENACGHLLRKQIPSENIHTIHLKPFSAALKKSFEIGIAQKRSWTMVIDADVLILPNFIKKLYKRAVKAPVSVFAVQSEMFDKFFGGTRVGGVKLYRTTYLPRAIELVPGQDVRPEAFVIKNMHKSGFYVEITDIVCGLHDFEQYYSDIFRKGYVHGVKHAEFASILLPFWERQASTDKDFDVLLAGNRAASKHKGALQLAKDEAKNQFTTYMKSSGIEEKEPFHGDIDVRLIMKGLSSPPEYYKVKKEIDKMGRPLVPKDAK